MAQQHKTCTVCGETKPLNGFHKDKGGKYGVVSRCKPCTKEYQRSWYESNRDEISERNRRYYEKNREEFAEYRRRHREGNREYRHRYQEENREIINSKVAKRQREERELVKPLATVPLFEPWSPGEDAFILADNGMTMYQKAVELGRTLASALGRRQRLLAKGGVSNDRANA